MRFLITKSNLKECRISKKRFGTVEVEDFDDDFINLCEAGSLGVYRLCKKIFDGENTEEENLFIKKIYPNTEKKTVSVIFEDGKNITVKCRQEDDFDVKIGVALAFAEHFYGSKTQFHNVVKELTCNVNDKKAKKAEKEKK